MERFEKALVKFIERERAEIEKVCEAEKKPVNINPNCYIAKEIKYQTALLHEIKKELSELNQEKRKQGK